MIKAYRYQIRYKTSYYDGIIWGKDAEEAGFNFVEKIKKNEIENKVNSYRGDRLYITYEEIENDDRKLDASPSRKNET
jgi:hypothetical protein